MHVLLVSSFVLPHAGGVEQFVATIRGMLEDHGCAVRLLACRLPGQDGTADAVVPALHLGATGWPLPVGGWTTLWREVGRADVIVANVSVHPLPVMTILAGRRRGVHGLLVVHGSGQGLKPGSGASGALRLMFQRTLGRLAMRRALPVSVSLVGLDGIARTYGVRGRHLPYPLPELPVAAGPAVPSGDEPLRVAWVGRLASEKDPLLAVRAIERLRASRPATLDVYGDGPLRPQLGELAASRPWLRLHGTRPWAEVLTAQERAHACLSTSAWDNVQVAVLEALSRGVPVVSTRVGDAPSYYRRRVLAPCCVPPGDPEAAAQALAALAGSYEPMRRAFADNAEELRAIHREAPRVLWQLIAEAGGRRAPR